MKNLLKKLSMLIYPQYGKYSLLILKNKMRFFSKKNHKFLFILSPPYCGSTLLNELISSSSSVSVNNPFDTREGQKLPSVRKLMFEIGFKKRWDTELDFNWEDIKKEWMKYWNLNCPVLLEKSPPNIIRSKSIAKIFNPSYFIIFYRNPYSHCESLIRRHNSKPSSAAEFAIKSLEYQIQNISELDNAIHFSYELLTEQTELAIDLMKKMLNELFDIQYKQKFSAHNYMSKKMEITNLNKDKISKLTNAQLNEINTVFLQK